MTARQPRELEGRDRRRVGVGLVVAAHQLRDDLEGAGPQPELRVVGAEPVRHRPRRGRLVVRPLLEADREGPDRPVPEPAHERHHGARVDPPAQERSERDVADQAIAHRLLQPLPQLVLEGGKLSPVLRRVLREVGQLPVAPGLHPAVAAQQVVSRLKLVDAAERTERRRHVLEGQVVVDRDGVHRPLGLAILEQRLELGAEG